ncbi:glutaredoxin family protein [Halapricum hydrolyticum]|uniref:Glutaredoxin family protein n=1 Tax=Halapricum hydrolyticum TaxID=2979991 RepID=A0AAE3LG48_9EURY|nr:glutaredoxin domain-containing protein [Halapricum hydrolyticum]MCU4719380.1 glutaredoxin family protein [Halapricum hydrolyticum]MCU4728355.1 glutaredoxin family protein [Halapricum hydrolyticum]
MTAPALIVDASGKPIDYRREAANFTGRMASEITRIIVVAAVMGVAVVGVVAVAQNQPGDPGSGEPIDNVQSATTVDGTADVCVVFFYAPGCPYCAEVEAYLESVAEEREITVKQYNVRTESAELLMSYYDRFDVAQRDRGPVPIVFVGDEYAVGSKEGKALIHEALTRGEPVACPVVNESAESASAPPSLAG